MLWAWICWSGSSGAMTGLVCICGGVETARLACGSAVPSCRSMERETW